MPRPVQTGTSTFRDLIENGFLYVDKTRYFYELVRYDIAQLRDLRMRELAFSTYEIETLSIVPLLFQTGYLTG